MCRLLLEERARMHLALLDHADGLDGPDGCRLRSGRSLGRRNPGSDADTMGERQLALLSDGRAHELHPEPDHDREPHSNAEQGLDFHHHRRPG